MGASGNKFNYAIFIILPPNEQPIRVHMAFPQT